MGQTRLSVFGFQIYDARLWGAPGFGGNSYSSQPLALELTYLRDFKALDIAERSIKEMRRDFRHAGNQMAGRHAACGA